MCFTDFLAVLSFCKISVVRPKSFVELQHGVGGPLQWFREDGWNSKSILSVFVVGGATVSQLGGRSILERMQKSKREFDATRGYPGEDGFHPSRDAPGC